ncbi:hypothetical protein [Staphylococcus nepalensis]|uniref:hypothetical protein n=1 Tax=Staphylococcus nepalensis TaxID=214473 RepID=UPI00383AFAF3
MREETATIRYKVYVEKKVYVNQCESDNDEIERIHNEMWPLRDEYMDAEPLEFEDVKIIDRGY